MTSIPPALSRPCPPQPGHLSNIQILRGVAAVMVLVYHIGNEISDRGYPGHFPDVGAGSAGVDIFFVVSGFVMLHSTAAAFATRGAPALFLARRIVRLVPLYWLITTVFCARWIWHSASGDVSAQTWRWFAASYAFLFYPHGDWGDFPVHPQGWTLNFEMVFYACFALALPFRRRVALAILCVGFLAFAILGLAAALPWPLDRWSNSNIVEFVLGLGLAQARAGGYRLSLPVSAALATAGLATFALTIGSVDAWMPYRGFVWGPPALAVTAAAALHPSMREGACRTALEALGDASYALYLVHYAVFVALGDALGRVVPLTSVPPAFYAGLCFSVAIAVAFVTHRHVERPITLWLDRALGLSRRWRTATAGDSVPDEHDRRPMPPGGPSWAGAAPPA